MERTVITPVTENAVIDFAIDIDLYNWAENNAPYLDGGEDTADNRLHFDNVQDFLDFYDGLHPREHPGMDNYRRDMERKAHRGDRSAKGSLKCYDQLADTANRHVHVDRIHTRKYQTASSVKTETLEGGPVAIREPAA